MLLFSRLYEQLLLKNYTVAGKREGTYYSIIYSEIIATEALSSIVAVDLNLRGIFKKSLSVTSWKIGEKMK